jgi:hypothetical protein
MPQPDSRGILVSGPLQDVSVQFRPGDYIADKIFPIIDKAPPKAKIAIYGKGAFFRDEAGIRGPGARAPRGGYPISYLDVGYEEYAFAKEVTDEDRRDARLAGSPPIQPDQDAVEFAAGKIDLKKERLIRNLIVATTWGDGNVGGEDAEGLWAACDTNTFLADVGKACAAIYNATGKKANKLLIDYGTFLSLKEEETLLAKIQYTERGILTPDLIAAACDLEECIIGMASHSSAKETKAGTDFTAAKIWEINATKGMGFVFHAPKTARLKDASAGYQVRGAYEDGQPRRVSTWRESAEHQDVYEVAEMTGIYACHAALGYLFKDTLLN